MVPVHAEQKRQPETIIELRPLGAASDLFAGNTDNSKYEKRGVLSALWLGSDRVAVAFSTNPRYGKSEAPEPLHMRLLIFDRSGKQQSSREWNFAATGPEGDATLDIEPGPDDSILAIHDTPTPPGAVPEGNFIQVLNPDTSLRQDFYVPATSIYAPAWPSATDLVLEQFFADKHIALSYYSGHPLASHAVVQAPPSAGDILVGPKEVARKVCPAKSQCTGINVHRSDGTYWLYANTSPEIVPVPRAFLDASSLLIELRHKDKAGPLIVAHVDGSQTQLPALPGGLEVAGVTGVSSNGQRFSIEAAGENGLCGAFDFFCTERARVFVIDVPTSHIVFEESLSINGGQTALSPDGHHLAILDHNALSIYAVP